MKENIKQKWLKRLRSGEIEQNIGSLGRPDGSRCCLGVLCDIGAEEKIIPAPVPHERCPEKLRYGIIDDTNVAILPQAIMDWAGLEHANPQTFHPIATLEDELEIYCLARANDLGFTFERIAEIIEEHDPT